MKPNLLPLALLLLAGCSGEDAKESTTSAPAPKETVQLAGKAVRTDGIALSNQGAIVHVGDAGETAQKLFSEPRGAYRLRSLPDRFGNDFEAHGWETNDGLGYGIITHDGLVVAAIYHADGLEAERARNFLINQRSGTGDLAIHEATTGKAKWTYWESGTQRLMVLLYEGKQGVDLTALMGDAKVLDALGAAKPSPSRPAMPPFSDPLTDTPVNG